MAMLVSAQPGAGASERAADAVVSNVATSFAVDYVDISMDVDLSKTKVGSNSALLMTPVITNGTDSLALPAIGVYGRRRDIYYQRNENERPATDARYTYSASSRPDHLTYATTVEYQPWMNGATVNLDTRELGCCGREKASATLSDLYTIAGPAEQRSFLPSFCYLRPEVEQVKSRSISGSAFVTFPVNKTFISTTYHNNAVELSKITESIDLVRSDKDVEITSVKIVGFASPEGSYANNDRLARERTAALKAYVNKLYQFKSGLVATDYVAENWQGLRECVESSNLTNRTAILEIIDSSMEPDAKEAKIKKSYPSDYQFIAQTYLPILRRSDYTINYTVRRFTDVAEIRRLVKTEPQKLSLNELYLAAESYDAGSDDYNYVFELAARLYPADATANLNAANIAMGKGDYTAARQYLEKAGDTPQADYARGVYAALNGDYATAEPLFKRAAAAGISEANDALEQLDALK